ncbi:hypothetical protein AWJ14_14435 [Hoeflea olei]|uniref:Uncharacterized protein n=1 Tax=Hoeflea olei TaxID=1480615 RepID=A0A1C1YQC8_9HYPH|nr:hypothetical protein AWJ14_14435 [Hoeflea olei]
MLLFAPLLAYSFFSAHTMPRFGAGGFAIVICSGDGAGILLTGEGSDPDDRQSKTPCDWSIQIHAAALADTAPVLAPLDLAWVEAVSFETALLRSGGLRSARHARAPPILL